MSVEPIVSEEFEELWRRGGTEDKSAFAVAHVGAALPQQRVWVRQGQMRRGYDDWNGPTCRDIVIPGEKKNKPWQATWTPRSDWVELPNVQSVALDQDFTDNGLMGCTIRLGNILQREQNNLGYLYHLRERGALSPFRGFKSPTRPAASMIADPALGQSQNEWYEVLVKSAQILVQQGYGDELAKTFTGIVDDVDPVTGPDTITLTMRDFGSFLTDQRLIHKNISPQLRDPVVFASIEKQDKDKGQAIAVGYGPHASSKRDGHPSRFVTTKHSGDTAWISVDRDSSDNTEWVEVRVPKGKYERIAVHPKYGGMTMYLGVKVTDKMMGGDPAEMDDDPVQNGWIGPIAGDPKSGAVPGIVDGGWPYIAKWEKVEAKGRSFDIGHELVVGSDTVFRIGFRNLKKVGPGRFRAGVIRFAPVKHKAPQRNNTHVGFDARASSKQGGTTHGAPRVLDEKIGTRWLSADRDSPDNTEWVEIKLPQGTYKAFRIHVPREGMDMYIGVHAKSRVRTNRKGVEETLPPLLNGVPIDEGWVSRSALQGGGTVPGSVDGDWSYVRLVSGMNKPPDRKTERYELFDDESKLLLGPDSVLRIGFRNLYHAGDGKYRAGVGKLKATRRGKPLDQSKKRNDNGVEDGKIHVKDAADIVRTVLRWAGFKEWEVQNVGTDLKGPWEFDYTQSYMDVINKVCDFTGFCFFMREPTGNDLSIGRPVFKYPNAYRDNLPDSQIKVVSESDLLTAMQAKITQEPLARIIRVRGAVNKRQGEKFERKRTERLMAVYRPPWVKNGRMAGKNTHFIHTGPKLKDKLSVQIFARIIALNMALKSATCTLEVPGTPMFQLDDQLGVLDRGTGFNTRVYVARRESTFEGGKWMTTVGGSLLDTPDVVGVKKDLLKLLPEGTSNISDRMFISEG